MRTLLSLFLVLGLGLALAERGPVRADEGAPPAPAGDGSPVDPKAKSAGEWISDLGHEEFAVRERATDALSQLGRDAVEPLEQAAASSDPEVRWRAEKALKAVKQRLAGPPKESLPPLERDPEPLESVPDALRQLDRGLNQLQPQLNELLREFPFEQLFPRELDEAFREMERTLRDLDQDPAQPLAPRLFQDFWTFRMQDGKWTFERSRNGPQGDERERRESEVERDGAPLGIRVERTIDIVRAQLGLAEGKGLQVTEVEAGSLAAQSGITRHDVIVSVDSAEVSESIDLLILSMPGDHRVGLIRAGMRFEVEPSAAPPSPKLRKF